MTDNSNFKLGRKPQHCPNVDQTPQWVIHSWLSRARVGARALPPSWSR